MKFPTCCFSLLIQYFNFNSATIKSAENWQTQAYYLDQTNSYAGLERFAHKTDAYICNQTYLKNTFQIHSCKWLSYSENSSQTWILHMSFAFFSMLCDFASLYQSVLLILTNLLLGIVLCKTTFLWRNSKCKNTLHVHCRKYYSNGYHRVRVTQREGWEPDKYLLSWKVSDLLTSVNSHFSLSSICRWSDIFQMTWRLPESRNIHQKFHKKSILGKMQVLLFLSFIRSVLWYYSSFVIL